METSRLAFVGIAHPHAPAWAQAVGRHAAVNLAYVYDPDPRAAAAFAETYGGRVASLDEVGRLAQLAIVDGRNDQNPGLAAATIDMGLATLIEKAGAMTSADLGAVAAAAERAGVVTHLGYLLRYSPAVDAAREALASGELGDLYLARFHCAIPHRAWDKPGWFTDPDTIVGGFFEAGCHMVDIVRELLGEPVEVRSTTMPSRAPLNHAEGAVAASLAFDGCVATLDFTAHEANEWNAAWAIELYGSRSTFRGTLLPASVARNDGGRGWQTVLAGPPGNEPALATAAQLENDALMDAGLAAFVDAAAGHAPSPVDARSGATTMALLERIVTPPSN